MVTMFVDNDIYHWYEVNSAAITTCERRENVMLCRHVGQPL